MGRVKEQSNIFSFDENFHGVLNHDGSIKWAKGLVLGEITHIFRKRKASESEVIVQGKKSKYSCQIHKNVFSDLIFCEVGDCGIVKWRNGTAWLVGFQKRQSYENERIQDRFLDEDENCDWNKFMRGVDVE